MLFSDFLVHGDGIVLADVICYLDHIHRHSSCTHGNLDPVAVPGVICHSHGPFSWGKSPAQAVYHAVVLEEVAKMATFTRMVKPTAAPAPQRIVNKHYMRKHGPNAYYGQK